MSHRASKWIKESKLHYRAYLSTYAPLLLISYLETQVSKTCRVWRRVTVGSWSWCRGGRDARFQDLQGLTLCGCGAVVLMRRRKLPCCSEGIFFPWTITKNAFDWSQHGHSRRAKTDYSCTIWFKQNPRCGDNSSKCISSIAFACCHRANWGDRHFLCSKQILIKHLLQPVTRAIDGGQSSRPIKLIFFPQSSQLRFWLLKFYDL